MCRMDALQPLPWQQYLDGHDDTASGILRWLHEHGQVRVEIVSAHQEMEGA